MRIEPLGAIALNPGRQDLRFPCTRSHVDTLELLDNLANAMGTDALRTGSDMLPLEEKAHQILGGNRLHRRSQACLRIAVDPGEQSTRTELIGQRGRLRITLFITLLESSAKHETFRLKGGKSDLHQARSHAQTFREGSSVDGPGRLKMPSKHVGDRGILGHNRLRPLGFTLKRWA